MTDHAYALRQQFLRPRMSWERKVALFFLAAACILILSTEAFGQSLAFKAVMCPVDWRATVSQRYDDRDRFDWIVKRTWITKCY